MMADTEGRKEGGGDLVWWSSYPDGVESDDMFEPCSEIGETMFGMFGGGLSWMVDIDKSVAVIVGENKGDAAEISSLP